MRLALRLSSIKPSATLAINAKAQELKRAGKKVTSLAVGEPDFTTPEHVKQAAKDALDADFTRYTPVPGIPELRQAVAGYFDRFYGVKAEAANTIVTNGGKQALFQLFLALLNPGDEVLVPAPYWVSYPEMLALAGAESVIVPATADKDYKIDVADLDRAVTPSCRMLIMNSPSNPTGASYTQAELDDIAAWAVKRGIFVVSDEIYDQLVYAPAKPASLSPWFARHPQGFAIVNGLAKSFAMTGWRVGYALADTAVIKGMNTLQGQSTSNVCSIAQKAALAALTGSYDCLDGMRAAYARRRDLALSVMAGWDGVVCPRPDGAFYLFPDFAGRLGAGANATDLCGRILEEAGVALVPGEAFGAPSCLRFSTAVADDVLVQALKAVGKIVATL